MLRSKNRLRALEGATITKVWAVWFVVATALPFTAPFATLDAADVWGHAHGPKAVTAVSAPDACSPQPDDSADDLETPDGSSQRVLPTTRDVRVLVTSPAGSRAVPRTVSLVTPAGPTAPTQDVSRLLVTLRL
jgi:hypothetical protein